jgi:PAS domain S-box-containing protein
VYTLSGGYVKYRTICLICIVIFLSILISGCEKAAVNQANESVRYNSYKDIPGVTEGEIKAIDALREKTDHFIYGMMPSTESFYGNDGEIKGYTALFCDWLTTLFGIPFKPEIIDWGPLLAGLAGFDIDFTGVMTATEERRETYFMTTTIAMHTIRYFRIVDSAPLEIVARMRPLRYGLMEGTSTIDQVVPKLKPGAFEIILARDIDTAYAMLKSGEIDAVFNENTLTYSFDLYGDVIGTDFFPLVYSSVSLTTQNPALEPIISVVQKALNNGALRYLVELYNTGYRDYLEHRLFMQFSEEERRFIQDNPVIHFVAAPGNYPVSFYNEREGKWQGIAFDVLREVEVFTGLRFELVNDANARLSTMLEIMDEGKASMIMELMYSTERANKFIWPETALLVDNSALISRSDYRNISPNEIINMKVGLVKGYAHTYLFREWFPDHTNTKEYEIISDAFDALDSGDVDMVMASVHDLLILTHYMERTGFKTNYIFNNPVNFTYAFNKDEAVLCSIVDKALQMIDTNRLSDQWIGRTYDYRRKILEAQYPWLIGSSVLFLCVLALVAVLFARNRRTGKQLERLVEKRTQDLELKTSMLTTIFDSSPDFIFCKDLKSRYTQCNKSMEDFFNITLADIMGKDDVEAFNFSPETAEEFVREDQKILNEKLPTIFEEFVMTQSGGGKELVVETIKAPLIQNGEIIGIMGISRDITKRKETENTLALQTAMLTTLFDSIPDFIFAKDVNFCYMQCNKSYLAHIGLSREDIIGKNDIDGLKMDPKLVEEYWAWDRKVISEGRKFMLEEHIPGVNGTNPLYETVKAPLMLDGEIIGVLGISHDITQRKEMEEAALAASRSKSAFLANMSHEIRTPMNSIMGFSELALDSEASPKTREYLTKIQSNTEWLLQIINNILDISKIESGKMELENIPFDMHELFESCRTLIIPKAVEKGLTLLFYAEPSIGKRSLGDPTRLRQVLVNLLSNAVKFTNSGTVKILTDIKEKSEKTVTFHFEIKDPGIGMTREQIERIFDPFTQAETGTTRKYGGTGLGLTISKNLIELMGGTLAVESTPGVGSKFSFDLTFDTVDINDYERFERKAVLDEIEKPLFNGEVLLCEDNVMNQQVISEHLARVGLKAVVAENGKVGVEKVESRKRKGGKQFDLILMDIHMPVMDGLEAAEKIIGLETGIPIVAMTANIMSNDVEIYKTSGMSDFIGKPFTSQELWRCLLKYLKPVKQEKNTPIEDDVKFQNDLKLIFAKTNFGKSKEIEKALEEGDIRQANRLAHSLKTNAGQIGEGSLQKAAGEVEQMLKEGKRRVTGKQLKKLETELTKVLEELEPLLEEDAAQAEERQVSTLEPEKIKELLDKLEPLINEGNIECLDYIDDLRAVPGSDLLIQQIEDFAFGTAVVTFAELKKRLGI